jgi:hypothetical protein
LLPAGLAMTNLLALRRRSEMLAASLRAGIRIDTRPSGAGASERRRRARRFVIGRRPSRGPGAVTILACLALDVLALALALLPAGLAT